MTSDDYLIQQLVQRGVLGQDGLMHLRGQAQASGTSLGALLVHRGVVTQQLLQEIFAEASRPPAQPAPGPSTIGPFEIKEELAEGGMGIVYRAYQPSLQRECALKVLSSMQIEDETVERFVAEAHLAARVGAHPNLVHIFDAGTTADGRAWLAMEFVEGKTTLSDWLAARRGTPQEAAAFLAQVCDALAHVHQHGIVHRDIKPANVLINGAGVPKLSDFGIAKSLAGGGSLTTTGSFLGTPGYMSPEQAEDPRAADARADVYGIGAVLYEVLTGRAPYIGPSAVTILSNMLSSDPPLPSELVPEVDRRLEAVCLRALERTPGDRYASALDLKAALEAALQPEVVRAPSKTGSARHRKGSARYGRSTSSRRSAQARRKLSRSSGTSHSLRPQSSAAWAAVGPAGSSAKTSLALKVLVGLGLAVVGAWAVRGVVGSDSSEQQPAVADRPAPRLKSLEPRNNAWVKPPFHVRGTVSPSGLNLRLVATPDDPKTQAPSAVLMRTAGEKFSTKLRLAHGTWTLALVALPKDGEPVALSKLSVRVDARPPTLEIQDPPKRIEQPSLILAGTCADPSKVELTLDGAPVEVVDGRFSREVVFGEPGPRTLRLRARDSLGNVITRSFDVNYAPPSLRVELSQKRVITRERTHSIQGRVHPQGASLKIHGQAVTIGERGVFSHEVSVGDGTQRIDLIAEHEGERVTETLTLEFDSDPPTITYGGGRKLRTQTPKLRLVFGEPVTSVQINDRPNHTFSPPKHTVDIEEQLAEGTHPLRVAAVDRAGNRGTFEVSLEVDTTPPAIDYEVVLKGLRPVGLKGTLVEAGSSVKLTWEGKTLLRKPGSFRVPFKRVPEGTQWLEATDGVGNVTRVPVVLLNLLRYRDKWSRASAKEQDAEIDAVAGLLGDAWERGATRTYTCAGITHRLASFLHRATAVEMILVPGAPYRVGTTNKAAAAEVEHYKDALDPELASQMVSLETPTRAVRLEPFLIGRTELQVREWDWLGLARPSASADATSEEPVRGVSWTQAQRWLKAAGGGLRLPSEAEWEYACRAGSTTRYFWGDGFEGRYCVAESGGVPLGGDAASNAFGLVHMAGNAWEWCADTLKGSHSGLRKTRSKLPWGPVVLEAKAYILRGGSCRTPAPFARSAARYWGGPELSQSDVGFRVVCSLPGLSKH